MKTDVCGHTDSVGEHGCMSSIEHELRVALRAALERAEKAEAGWNSAAVAWLDRVRDVTEERDAALAKLKTAEEANAKLMAVCCKTPMEVEEMRTLLVKWGFIKPEHVPLRSETGARVWKAIEPGGTTYQILGVCCEKCGHDTTVKNVRLVEQTPPKTAVCEECGGDGGDCDAGDDGQTVSRVCLSCGGSGEVSPTRKEPA